MRDLFVSFQGGQEQHEVSDRGFGLTIGTIFVVLSSLPEVLQKPPKLWMAGAGLALIGLAAVAPRTLRWVKRGWLFLGFLLGQVTSPVVLAVLFYGVVTPCGWAMRLAGGDPLRLKRSGDSTFWVARQGLPSRMEDPF